MCCWLWDVSRLCGGPYQADGWLVGCWLCLLEPESESVVHPFRPRLQPTTCCFACHSQKPSIRHRFSVFASSSFTCLLSLCQDSIPAYCSLLWAKMFAQSNSVDCSWFRFYIRGTQEFLFFILIICDSYIIHFTFIKNIICLKYSKTVILRNTITM